MWEAGSVALLHGLGPRAASAVNTEPWTARLMRKAGFFQVKGSGLCCGEKLGKEPTPGTLRALFLSLPMAGLTHFKISSQLS